MEILRKFQASSTNAFLRYFRKCTLGGGGGGQCTGEAEVGNFSTAFGFLRHLVCIFTVAFLDSFNFRNRHQ